MAGIYHRSESHYDTSPWERSQGREEEDVGRKRSVRANSKHEMNPAFDRLLSDHEHGRIKNVQKTRPAYAYTSQCFDKDFQESAPPKRLEARLSEDV